MRLPVVAFSIVVAFYGSTAPQARAQSSAQERFMARCQDRLSPKEPAMAEIACREIWPTVTASNRMIDAFLPLFSGPAPRSPREIQQAMPSVAWRAVPEQGSVATGRLGDLTVSVSADEPREAAFSWSEVGAMIPYAPAEGLRTRGATVVEIGCYDFGVSESNTVYRVDAPGHAAFALTVYRREAPTGNAWSSLSASARIDRHVPTLAELRSREPDTEWKVGCQG